MTSSNRYNAHTTHRLSRCGRIAETLRVPAQQTCSAVPGVVPAFSSAGRMSKAFQKWMVGVEGEDANGPGKIRSSGPSERQAAEARENTSLERELSGSQADDAEPVGTLDCSLSGAWNRYAALRLQLLTLRVDRYMLMVLAAVECTHVMRCQCGDARISCDYGPLLPGDSRLSRAAMTTSQTQTTECSAVRSGCNGKSSVVVLEVESAHVAARLLLADSAIVADWQFPFWRAHYPQRK
ncbi:hypothetical protein IQ06DRAFT_297754 [Phaeosphaeriaceae sp. SRC1lsM3a]|nr:hypothetical protein IQ06DRAFT_297754 [Stagonospora sp. SRC1lsM3a]